MPRVPMQLSPWWLIGGSIAVMVLAGVFAWFALPGASAKHHFVSPTGRVALDVGETCGEAVCDRRITAEIVAPDGSKARRGCAFSLPATHLVLLNAYPLWASDEQTVDIVHADSDGQGGKFTIDIARDCTITE
ncbi:hypothetical protein PRN20_09660 [Devosia sp. ZB163]|uniref:hypothetical protein n=1 Tax=Devosia sp. ZB163 TaxID=3025938 RepID=UPI00235ED747|nr:hypothetical protein [Devosia sp. ZB163]MDC9824001.1 hypothetical protein [Devosia sp. ZB163]